MQARPVVRALLGVLLMLWILAPMLPILLWAVAGQWRAPAVLPTSYSLEALASLGDQAAIGAGLASLGLGVAVAVVATPLGLLGAVAARRLPRLRGKTVDLILLAPLAVPPFALVMGANTTLLRLHVPAFAGVVLLLAVTALPYTAFMYRSALA
ncbi:ABC-type spermidine/putrescine transport system permease subunit II, partial [Arthrobacter sp. CAN_A2]